MSKSSQTIGLDLPVYVDLRPELLPVRDQGETRPTCLAFAATAAHEFARNLGIHLCVEFLYFNAKQTVTRTLPQIGLTLDSVRVALREEGQPVESSWPYILTGPNPEAPPSMLGPKFNCALEFHNNPDAVALSLRCGVPVIVALEISRAWFSNLAPDYVIDEEDENPNIKSSIGHAVLAIGIREDNLGNTLILIQNSWGIRWAENGCAWISMNYLDRHFVGSMVVRELL